MYVRLWYWVTSSVSGDAIWPLDPHKIWIYFLIRNTVVYFSKDSAHKMDDYNSLPGTKESSLSNDSAHKMDDYVSLSGTNEFSLSKDSANKMDDYVSLSGTKEFTLLSVGSNQSPRISQSWSCSTTWHVAIFIQTHWVIIFITIGLSLDVWRGRLAQETLKLDFW